MYNIFVGILQASGDSTHPLYYLITSSAINVVLDITLIGVFHMGVDGAALATIVSQGIAALLVMIRLLRQSGDIRISFSKIGFHWRRLREIVLFGLPTAVQNTVIDFSNVLIQSYINSFSAAAMAGIGAYAKVEGFAFLPVTAFSMAMATFISQNIGARKLDRVKDGIRFGLLCSVAAVAGSSSSSSRPSWWPPSTRTPTSSPTGCSGAGSAPCSSACWAFPTCPPPCSGALASPWCPCWSC